MATEFISNSWLMPTNANAEANRVSNYSLDFDGSSQYVNISDVSSISTNTQGSISFWLNFAGDSITRYAFGISDTNANTFLTIGINSSENLDIIHREAGINLWRLQTTGSPIILNTWQHICLTQDSTACEVYVNGVKPTQSGAGTEWLSSLSGLDLLTIGALYKSSALVNSIEGKITEVSIFDYALSGSQVLELYGTGSAIGNPMAITNGRKPVAYYPLGNSAFNSEFLTPNSAEKDFVFDFDASSNDYIEVANNSSLQITDNLTLSCWINADNVSATNSIIDKFFDGSDRSYMLRLQSSRIRISLGNTDGSSSVNYQSTSTLSNNIWYHIVTTFSSADNEVKIYINGSLDSTHSKTDLISSNNGELRIGTGYNLLNYFDGKISNCAVFNTALPATGTESVASLYNYGTPPNIASYSNLQAWWELDASATFDGSNFSIPDASSNSNTGTSSGMTAANLVQSDLIINAPYDSFALDFDGVDERISFTETDLGLNNSISIWFKRPSTGTNVLIGQGSAWYDYAVRIESNGSIKYADRYTSPTITFDNASTKLVVNNTNTWVNIVIVRTGSTANLYVNGVNYDGSKSWGSGSEEGTVFNRLATAGDGTSFGFNGQLSNFASWNTSLTSAQALEVYNEAKPSNLNNHSASSSLVSWYRLGAVNTFYNSTTTEFTVLDEVGTNEGTSVNMEQGDLVDGVGATGSGTSSGMGSGENRIGSAPFSESNSVSYNMSVTAKSTSTPT